MSDWLERLATRARLIGEQHELQREEALSAHAQRRQEEARAQQFARLHEEANARKEALRPRILSLMMSDARTAATVLTEAGVLPIYASPTDNGRFDHQATVGGYSSGGASPSRLGGVLLGKLGRSVSEGTELSQSLRPGPLGPSAQGWRLRKLDTTKEGVHRGAEHGESGEWGGYWMDNWMILAPNGSLHKFGLLGATETHGNVWSYRGRVRGEQILTASQVIATPEGTPLEEQVAVQQWRTELSNITRHLAD